MNEELKNAARSLVDTLPRGNDVVRDLLTEIERLEQIAAPIINGSVAAEMVRLNAKIDSLETQLVDQKRAAWNHEGISKDYTLATQKVHQRDKQIEELTRQRDILAEYAREREVTCWHCWDCSPECHINQAKQALADAGMEGKS